MGVALPKLTKPLSTPPTTRERNSLTVRIKFMSDFTSHLRAAVEKVRERSDADLHRQRMQLHTAKTASKPLTQQIEELMRSLPPAQRNRAWAMAELVSRLDGRYQQRPSAGDVGQALRSLGWVKKRDWSSRGEGRRVWLQYREDEGALNP